METSGSITLKLQPSVHGLKLCSLIRVPRCQVPPSQSSWNDYYWCKFFLSITYFSVVKSSVSFTKDRSYPEEQKQWHQSRGFWTWGLLSWLQRKTSRYWKDKKDKPALHLNSFHGIRQMERMIKREIDSSAGGLCPDAWVLILGPHHLLVV